MPRRSALYSVRRCLRRQTIRLKLPEEAIAWRAHQRAAHSFSPWPQRMPQQDRVRDFTYIYLQRAFSLCVGAAYAKITRIPTP